MTMKTKSVNIEPCDRKEVGAIHIWEYCLQGVTDWNSAMTFDEAGNCYLSGSFAGSGLILRELRKMLFQDIGAVQDMEWLFISADRYKELLEYEIIVDEEVKDYKAFARRPYYRMRGKRVTEEQALDIIRRVDRFFGFKGDVTEHMDYIGSLNFDNWIFDPNHYPSQYGWVHVDGTIGCNGITQKYPNIDELIAEWFEKMKAFPYLDLVIAITNWDESPPCVRDTSGDAKGQYRKKEFSDFLEDVECGIWVHDKVLEIMSPGRTVKTYVEYAKLYEDKNKEKYQPEYYNEHGIVQADLEYLKKCIEAYGLDADEELGKIKGRIW